MGEGWDLKPLVGGIALGGAALYIYLQMTKSADADRVAFERDGYLIKRSVLDARELAIVRETMEGSDFLERNEMSVESDDKDKPGRQTIWNKAGTGTLGALTRSEKIAGTAENLLGGNGVLHYFNKRLLKKAGDLGRWQWHQDYGSYWYFDHFLHADMLTCWVAIDAAGKRNGGLRVVPKSHMAGRIDCITKGNQRVSDPVRVDALVKKYGLLQVELDAGDAIFFHGNLLHSSEGNGSDARRLAFAAHFSAGNNPMFAPELNGDLGVFSEPMEVRPHAEIKRMGVVVDDAAGLGLMEPKRGAELTAKRKGDQGSNK